MNFDKAFELLISHEGGLVSNPKDPGGLTKYGISQKQYPNLDIANLTLPEVKELYKRDFWDRAQCDKLAPDLAFDVFDAAVNSGIGQAIRWLQRSVNVVDDGVIGPLTLAAVQRLDDTSAIRARFSGHRLEFMSRLSTFDVFGRGWTRRVAANLQKVGS